MNGSFLAEALTFFLFIYSIFFFFLFLSLTAPVPLRGTEKAASTRYRPHHPPSEQLVSLSKSKPVHLHCHRTSVFEMCFYKQT